jgi:hypothetical protein
MDICMSEYLVTLLEYIVLAAISLLNVEQVAHWRAVGLRNCSTLHPFYLPPTVGAPL